MLEASASFALVVRQCRLVEARPVTRGGVDEADGFCFPPGVGGAEAQAGGPDANGRPQGGRQAQGESPPSPRRGSMGSPCCLTVCRPLFRTGALVGERRTQGYGDAAARAAGGLAQLFEGPPGRLGATEPAVLAQTARAPGPPARDGLLAQLLMSVLPRQPAAVPPHCAPTPQPTYLLRPSYRAPVFYSHSGGQRACGPGVEGSGGAALCRGWVPKAAGWLAGRLPRGLGPRATARGGHPLRSRRAPPTACFSLPVS